MKNSKIILSAFTACAIFSIGLADSGLGWENNGGWKECPESGCNTGKENAGIYSQNDDVSNAEVKINSNHNGRVYGGYSANKKAENNELSIDSGTFKNGAYGGYSIDGNSKNNKLVINGGTLSASSTINDAAGYSKNGNAYKNEITVNSGYIDDFFNGGFSENGNANENKITIQAGTFTKYAQMRGGNSTNGNADKNAIEIYGGSFSADISGGRSEKGEVNKNTVLVTGTASASNIYGGQSRNSGLQANENNVTISGQAKVATVYGGFSNQANTDKNTVIITDEATASTVNGGNAGNAQANENTVIISGTAKTNNINGGYGKTGANENKVIIGGNSTGAVTGGNGVDGSAHNNEVIINGDTSANITGGTGKTSADDNKVIISGNSTGEVKGGNSSDGNANKNEVTINGSSNGNVSGGEGKTSADDNKVIISGNSTGEVKGGNSSDGNANKNEVTIKGSSSGNVSGGIGKTSADENKVSISGNSEGEVKGGVSSDETANKNEVTINGSSNGNVSGGEGKAGANENKVSISGDSTGTIKGGISSDETANNNSVVINGNSNGNVTGGEGKKDTNGNKVSINGDSNQKVIGGNSSTGNSNNNEVFIGGDAKDNVIGGNGKISANNNKINIGGSANSDVIGGKGDNEASNNSVNIAGNVAGNIVGGQSAGITDKNEVSVYGDVTGNIYGGFDGSKGHGNDNTINLLGDLTKVIGDIQVGSKDGKGNTLNIITQNPTQITGSVSGAQNINLDISGLKKGDSALKVGSIDVDGANIDAVLRIKGGYENFKNGDSLKLIEGNVIGTAQDANIKAIQGGTLEVKFNFDPSNLTGEMKGEVVGITKESKALSEGVVSAAAVLSAENDNISQKGVANAMAATTTTLGAGSVAVASFGSMNAGANTIKTGSHVKTDGINAMFGLAVGKEFDNGKLTIGPFIEFGTSDYETFNDTDSGEIKGDGENKFIGAGLLARYDFGSIFESRAYVEGSARAGRNRNKYTNKHITDGFGNYVDYNLNSNYFGAHFGAGYELKLDAHSFDFYAKYFYTRLGGKSVEVLGMPYDFKAVKSHRLQAGVKYELEIKGLNDTLLLPYAGLGYEYEFDGKSKAYVAGYEIKSPTLKGGSGYGDLGLSFANANKKGFRLDIGARGYFGKRRGLSGIANAKYEF